MISVGAVRQMDCRPCGDFLMTGLYNGNINLAVARTQKLAPVLSVSPIYTWLSLAVAVVILWFLTRDAYA